jgi:hypothetical protein
MKFFLYVALSVRNTFNFYMTTLLWLARQKKNKPMKVWYCIMLKLNLPVYSR